MWAGDIWICTLFLVHWTLNSNWRLYCRTLLEERLCLHKKSKSSINTKEQNINCSYSQCANKRQIFLASGWNVPWDSFNAQVKFYYVKYRRIVETSKSEAFDWLYQILLTTLQSMMNTKLSKQRFWHCYEIKHHASRRFKWYPTTYRWVSSQLPFTVD